MREKYTTLENKIKKIGKDHVATQQTQNLKNQDYVKLLAEQVKFEKRDTLSYLNNVLQLPNIWIFRKNYTDSRDSPWSIVWWKNSNSGQSRRYKAKSCCKGLSTWCKCTHRCRWSPSSCLSRCHITCNKSCKD